MMAEYFFTYEFATGAERWKGSGPSGIAAIQNLPVGFGIVTVSEADFSGVLADVPLATLQLAVWSRVKAKRDAAINGGAMTPIGMVDSNELSRTNITGAAVGALIAQAAGAPFSIEWTAQDNSVHTLDGAGMIALGMAALQHVSHAHDVARDFRVAIEAAASVTDLLMIDIDAGWS